MAPLSYTIANHTILLERAANGAASTLSWPATHAAPLPIVRSQCHLRGVDPLFACLFDLAQVEAAQCAVESIGDWAMNHGQVQAHSVYETGADWNQVWTRDIAYAAYLGLPGLDPQRVRRSLELKVSPLKSGGRPQIVQDTGSGGSYPVSSDRVVWALGAWALSPLLTKAARVAFEEKALAALKNSLELDRQVLWEPADGLYRGEQSFLDWRAQSYPCWMAEAVAEIGASKALCTNLLHLHALEWTAALCETHGVRRAQRYRSWAAQLRESIAETFWQPESAYPAAFILGAPYCTPSAQRSLLAESLASLMGVAPKGALSSLSNYPMGGLAPPVLWPQDRHQPIYHNRGSWPFVTALTLLTARKENNPALFEHCLDALVRGAALSGSNMECLEWQHLNHRDAPGQPGPIMSSRRQLWSVAGYMGAIIRGLFGLEIGDRGLRMRPFVSRAIQRRYLGAHGAELRGLSLWGKKINLVLEIGQKEDAAEGLLDLQEVCMDGQAVAGWIVPETLPDGATLSAKLSAARPTRGALHIVANGPHYGPAAPELKLIHAEEGAQLGWQVEPGCHCELWRQKHKIAEMRQISGRLPLTARGSYLAIAIDQSTGLRSRLSRAVDFNERVLQVGAADMVSWGGYWQVEPRPHYAAWGEPEHRLALQAFKPPRDGSYGLRLTYANGCGPVETGICAGSKWLWLSQAGRVLRRCPVLLPQLGQENWARVGQSAWVELGWLSSELSYDLILVDGINMSYFEYFRGYTGARGGQEGPHNHVDLFHMTIYHVISMSLNHSLCIAS